MMALQLKRNPWTAEQRQKLRKLHREGLTFNEIANRMDRSRPSVYNEANRLRLPAREFNKHNWTASEESRLRKLVGKRLPPAEVAKRMGMSISACRHKAYRLGLTESP